MKANNMFEQHKAYTKPSIELVKVSIQQCIAASDDVNGSFTTPGFGDEIIDEVEFVF